MRSRYLEIVVLSAFIVCTLGCRNNRPAVQLPLQAGSTGAAGLSIELPTFGTLEELKTWYHAQAFTQSVQFIENGEARAAVIRAEWGSGDSWDAIYIYAPTGPNHQWVPRAVWNTEARNVEVNYDKALGTIQVQSAKAIPVFPANVSALAARQSRDW